MECEEKISLLKGLCNEITLDVGRYYEVLDKCGMLRSNYCEYMRDKECG